MSSMMLQDSSDYCKQHFAEIMYHIKLN